ncbi:MAG TPA: glycosyltransferase family 4 protein [Ignavibacteria bacterium]|nr:glycosyltransferase family 4 protein [Ignavibacteria bacterium]HMR38816.1 glycosyltransferase family 4 protein [Ignavibacteria bacterium]
MRVAVYSGNIPSTTFIENLIKGLDKYGFEILLFGKLKGTVNYGKNVKVYPTPVRQLPLIFFIIKNSFILMMKDPGKFFKAIKAINRKNKSTGAFLKNMGMILPILIQKHDIFHIQWAKTVLQNPELFELLDSKIILSLRGAHINYSPLTDKKLSEAYRKYFPVIDGYHAVSEAIKKETVKYGAAGDRIKVIYSSVNKDLLQLNSEKEPAAGSFEIISIGRFHWKKGYHYALDTMKILKDRKIKFRYTIIAQGKVPEEILFLINEYELNGEVNIIPGMKFDELIKRLIRSDMLILPSVEEGIANVVLESMAAGVPVVTTDCGGMNEAVEDNINGYIVRIREPELMADKISEYIRSEGKSVPELIKNAKAVIEEKFSPERQIKDFADLYSTTLNS